MTLREALEDIARFESADLDYITSTYAVPKPAEPATEYGGNRFSEVTSGDFGRFFDFEVISLQDGRNVFYADSDAAWAWTCDRMPDCQPRYGARGWVIDQNLDTLIDQAEKAGLVDKRMAEQEFVG